MILESKYNFGDTVYSIGKINSSEWEECSVCLGNGRVELNNKEYLCPECNGHRGKNIYTGRRWKVEYPSKTIGRINIQVYPSKYRRNQDKDTVSYMCEETGIGSGTIWYQCDLYDSVEIAQERCDMLNSIIETKREQIKNEILDGRMMSQYGLWSDLEKEINTRMSKFNELELL